MPKIKSALNHLEVYTYRRCFFFLRNGWRQSHISISGGASGHVILLSRKGWVLSWVHYHQFELWSVDHRGMAWEIRRTVQFPDIPAALGLIAAQSRRAIVTGFKWVLFCRLVAFGTKRSRIVQFTRLCWVSHVHQDIEVLAHGVVRDCCWVYPWHKDLCFQRMQMYLADFYCWFSGDAICARFCTNRLMTLEKPKKGFTFVGLVGILSPLKASIFCDALILFSK